jgi:hypothetical protein
MVIMAAFAILYPFIQEYVSNYQRTTGLTIQERFVIEDVWFTPENETHIYLRNVGKIGINFTEVYVNGSSYSTSLYLNVNEHNWLNLTDCKWNYDTSYHIRVITERGNIVEGYYKSPKQQ